MVRLVSLAAALLLLTACAGGGAPPAPRYYVLTPVSVANVVEGQSTLSIELVSLRLPHYLERPQIVTRSASNRLVLNDWHQWGGNLRKEMTHVLARNLSERLGTPDVAVAPFSAAGSPDARVALEVMQFERGPDGRVQLSVQWRITGANARPLQTRFTDLLSETVHAPADFDGTVAAMSALLGELSRIIADAIRTHLPPRAGASAS